MVEHLRGGVLPQLHRPRKMELYGGGLFHAAFAQCLDLGLRETQVSFEEKDSGQYGVEKRLHPK